MPDQHDDHIWLTVYGEPWAIRRLSHIYGGEMVFYLWRGYEPKLEYLNIIRADTSWEDYCNAAVAMLEQGRERDHGSVSGTKTTEGN